MGPQAEFPAASANDERPIFHGPQEGQFPEDDYPRTFPKVEKENESEGPLHRGRQGPLRAERGGDPERGWEGPLRQDIKFHSERALQHEGNAIYQQFSPAAGCRAKNPS